MAVRVQVILDAAEREEFRRRANAEGLSLSAWLRQAGRERLQAEAGRRLASVEDLREFFARQAERELGREPGWDEHEHIIEQSRRSGAATT
jgi:hypothetical protein